MNKIIMFLIGVLVGTLIVANSATKQCNKSGYSSWDVKGCFNSETITDYK